MGATQASSIVFAFVFGGAMLGMFLRPVLPPHHLRAGSKDIIRLGMGLIATMAALVLGLLVASAKEFYDSQIMRSPRSPPTSSSSTANLHTTDRNPRKPAISFAAC